MNEKLAPHGTVARYEYNCSCVKCRRANAASVRERRAKARKRFKSGKVKIKHGTQVGYDYWGCKCDKCTAANTARHLAKRQRSKK